MLPVMERARTTAADIVYAGLALNEFGINKRGCSAPSNGKEQAPQSLVLSTQVAFDIACAGAINISLKVLLQCA